MKNNWLLLICAVVLAACGENNKQPVDYVNPFVGTGFHGHTYPGATAPYGAVQLSPDTRKGNWDACSGYHYSDSTLLGFSHTHLSGTGCIDLGDVLFHPTTQQTLTNSGEYIFSPLPFSHKDEKASPGYYSVHLKEEGIKAELTATTYTGVHRYTYDKGKNQKLIVDMAHLLTDEVIDSVYVKQTADNEIIGMRRTQGWVLNQYVFFVAQFSKGFEDIQFVNDGKILQSGEEPQSSNQQIIINFGISDGTPVVAKVSFSIVSEANARENLQADISGFDFDAVHQGTRNKWEEALADITVVSNNESDLVNFYTAAYHTKIIPNVVSDANGSYRRHDMSISTAPADQKRYSTFSLWDTYRAWNPLMTLTNHELVNDMINSYLDMYDATGELPIWPLSAGETGTMIGYHAVSVIADAYVKGIRGYDAEKAFEAMKVSSDINKKGSDYYIKYGFIPSNIKRESVSCLLEYAYDDWCIAQMAKSLGKEQDHQTYINRSLNYLNVFDGKTKFFRGKRLDGNWEEPFNPFAPGRAYTEATAWQYRFYVPHDVNGMIQLFGGKETFTNQLDSLFIVESKLDGHMQDITGLIGQYAHGNEPSHHMAYLYNYVGQPWKTQEKTRRILREMYQPTPEGIIGNEDCGQMSAWYIFSSLGLYPVCPGSNEFVLTTPLFEKATVQLANRNTLEIVANNPERNIYIQKVLWNGVEVETNYITYNQLIEGGTLEFVLSSEPNTQWGTSPETYPYSLTQGNVVSVPYTSVDLDLFERKITVDLASATPDARIYYTLNGKEPDETTTLYTAPFDITADTRIKAKAYKDGFQPSKTFEILATKAVFDKAIPSVSNPTGVNYEYYEGYYQSVNEIEKTPVVKRGTMDEPSISDARQEDHFAYVFSGFIYVPEKGVYEFSTISDDGSVLYINDKKIVDNDGSHAAIMATGRIALEQGFHWFKLMYFEDYEGEHLSWGWKTPSSGKHAPIPKENLRSGYLKLELVKSNKNI